MKVLLWFFATVVVIAALALCAGYFDPELNEVRRLSGCSLIVAGMTLAWPAVIRIVEDWPRMKPRYNVDLAFIQIAAGVVILTIAFLLGGRFGAFVSPLTDRPPQSARRINCRQIGRRAVSSYSSM